jgi:hypothetical protein
MVIAENSPKEKSLTMTAEVPTFQTATADPLAALHAERDVVLAEIERFRKVDEARQAAERELASLDAEQASIDAAEMDAWSDWAATCDGPPPSPRTQARDALARLRVAAAASLAGALNGVTAVAARRMALNAEFRRLGDEIFEVRVEKLLVEAADLHETASEAARTLISSAQRLDATLDAFLLSRADAMTAANHARVKATTGAINALEAMKRPEIVGDPNERGRIAAEVRRMLDE